jgi:hypothetical protein
MSQIVAGAVPDPEQETVIEASSESLAMVSVALSPVAAVGLWFTETVAPHRRQRLRRPLQAA